MNQLSMFPEQVVDKHLWVDMIVSVSNDQASILRNISRLYMAGERYHVDVCYSKGVFWKNLPEPVLAFDIDPQLDHVRQADCRHLPLADCTINSLVFDPPFKASNSKVKGIIEGRFTAYGSVQLIWEFYHDAMQEFMRVLQPGGILVIKCQDTVSSGVNHWSHREIEKFGETLGFEQLDLFILLAKSVMWSPSMKVQKHARKAHSFFIVFCKPTPKKGKSND